MAAPRRSRARIVGGGDEDEVQRMAARLQALEVENKSLRKKVKDGGAPGQVVLTERAKDVLVVGASSKLSAAACRKIEERVRKETRDCLTQEDVETALAGLSFRLTLSYADVCGAGAGAPLPPGAVACSRRRAKSRTRNDDNTP